MAAVRLSVAVEHSRPRKNFQAMALELCTEQPCRALLDADYEEKRRGMFIGGGAV